MAVGTLARFCYSHVRISERSRTLECARSVNDSVLVLPLRRALRPVGYAIMQLQAELLVCDPLRP